MFAYLLLFFSLYVLTAPASEFQLLLQTLPLPPTNASSFAFAFCFD